MDQYWRKSILVDLHNGSFRRTKLLQLRANMLNADVVEFSEGFDGIAAVHSESKPGMLCDDSLQQGVVARHTGDSVNPYVCKKVKLKPVSQVLMLV